MNNQTTVSDVLTHVQTQQAAAQAELDALFARRRNLPSDEERWTSLQIENAHGKVLALASLCGYLEARISIDEINALYA